MTALSFIFWVVLGGAVGSLLVGIITYTRYLIWLWKDHKTQIVTITPVVPSSQAFAIAGRLLPQAAVSPEIAKPLVETWSNEKIKAWRVINVTVKKGDPDGLWLGFPHPDGPIDDVVTPVRHPIGVELHAECRSRNELLPDCHTIPGERCASTYGSGCGFYAFKTREQAIEYLETELMIHTYLKRAVAHVLLSGKVIEHEDGYRAEILEVVSIEPAMPYRDSFSSTIEATRQAFDAYAHIFSKLTGSNFPDIVSRGV